MTAVIEIAEDTVDISVNTILEQVEQQYRGEEKEQQEEERRTRPGKPTTHSLNRILKKLITDTDSSHRGTEVVRQLVEAVSVYNCMHTD